MTDILYSILFGTDSRPDMIKRDGAMPVQKEISPSVSRFDSDVEALQRKYGEMRSGLCIETTLRELLEVCPRKRARTDSYNSLVSYLKVEFGVSLIIKTQKRK